MTARGRKPGTAKAGIISIDSATRAPDAARSAAFHRGVSAESEAASYLVAKGFRILSQRWRSPRGEIDIVAQRQEMLVFVEVKARLTVDAAAEAVTPRQRRRIVAAAELWLARHADIAFTDIRFDAVLVAPGQVPHHIPSAFDGTV